MTRVAVIGSGFVGRAWAISFARARYDVALWDQDKEAPSKAKAYVEQLLPDLEANDLLNGAKASEVASRVRVATTLELALESAVHVQENTPEDVEVKRAVFARARRGRAGRRGSSELDLCHPALGLHRKPQGPGALSRHPPDQSALSHSCRRSRPRAVDGPGGRRARRRCFCVPRVMRRSS